MARGQEHPPLGWYSPAFDESCPRRPWLDADVWAAARRCAQRSRSVRTRRATLLEGMASHGHSGVRPGLRRRRLGRVSRRPGAPGHRRRHQPGQGRPAEPRAVTDRGGRLPELIEEGMRSGRLHATTDCARGGGRAPSWRGSASAPPARRTAASTSPTCGGWRRHWARPCASGAVTPVVVIRSTVLPGTTSGEFLSRSWSAPPAGAWGGSASASTPSSCARARAVADYYEPPKVVVGAIDHGGPRRWSPRWRPTRRRR